MLLTMNINKESESILNCESKAGSLISREIWALSNAIDFVSNLNLCIFMFVESGYLSWLGRWLWTGLLIIVWHGHEFFSIPPYPDCLWDPPNFPSSRCEEFLLWLNESWTLSSVWCSNVGCLHCGVVLGHRAFQNCIKLPSSICHSYLQHLALLHLL